MNKPLISHQSIIYLHREQEQCCKFSKAVIIDAHFVLFLMEGDAVSLTFTEISKSEKNIK